MPRSIFACTYENCSLMFRHMEKYDNHLRTHTGKRPFICLHDECGKSYTRKSHLRRHEETHESNYNCTVPGCAKILTTKATLKKHVDIFHKKMEPKKYQCSECSKEFNKHRMLQVHTYTHTGIKPYPCPKPNCDKSFTMPCKLTQHLKCHRGYTCNVSNCEQVFPRWSLLVKHKRECHIKIFKCSVCDKEFKHSTNLKNHSLIHEDEREVFKCPIPKCARIYQAKRHLADHLKYFHGARPLTCPYDSCQRFFKTEDEKAIHIAYRHQPRKRKKKPPRPDFAEILAGCAKGTRKELNPPLTDILLDEKPECSKKVANELIEIRVNLVDCNLNNSSCASLSENICNSSGIQTLKVK